MVTNFLVSHKLFFPCQFKYVRVSFLFNCVKFSRSISGHDIETLLYQFLSYKMRTSKV